MKEAYDSFLKYFEETARGLGIEIVIDKFDKDLREDFNNRQEARELREMFANVKRQTEDLLSELVPLIKEPYARRRLGKGPGREGPA